MSQGPQGLFWMINPLCYTWIASTSLPAVWASHMLPVNQCQDKWVSWDNVLEVPANPQILTTEKLSKTKHLYCYLSHSFQDIATVSSLSLDYFICFLATIFTPSVSVLSALSNCEVENCLTFLFKSVHETPLNVEDWQAFFLLCICDFLMGKKKQAKNKTKPKTTDAPSFCSQYSETIWVNSALFITIFSWDINLGKAVPS